MPDNFDRRLTPRDPIPIKTPKEGDKFFFIREDGHLGEELTVDSVGYEIDTQFGIVFGVVPYEDDSRSYEIWWNFDRECWTVLQDRVSTEDA